MPPHTLPYSFDEEIFYREEGYVDLMLGCSTEPTRSQYQTVTRCDKNS
ncbi:hypothetical protein [uncultured Campylobacter sp.]|nr:hypothetical protein [uncultured Campylobacter sp.]